MRSTEEILIDIDETLDQLIKNAAASKVIIGTSLYKAEVEALQKTQESLLARLIHMQDLLKGENNPVGERENFKGLEQKIKRFGKLNAQVMHRVSARIKRMKNKVKS
jgi:hypothetical protein